MNKLTIDEIIEHCKRKTAMYEQLNGVKTLENADISNNFIKEYWEHRQVLGYLEELRSYRAIGTVEECREARGKQRFTDDEICQIKSALDYIHDADLSEYGEDNIKSLESAMRKLGMDFIDWSEWVRLFGEEGVRE